jgi:hypothetical protein
VSIRPTSLQAVVLLATLVFHLAPSRQTLVPLDKAAAVLFALSSWLTATNVCLVIRAGLVLLARMVLAKVDTTVVQLPRIDATIPFVPHRDARYFTMIPSATLAILER